MGRKYCGPCSEIETRRLEEERAAQAAAETLRLAEAHRLAEERKLQAAIDREMRLQAFLALRIEQLHALLDQGVTPYLYDSKVLDSQSYFNESASPRAWNFQTATGPIGSMTTTDDLQRAGWLGWQVIGVIPVTYGATLYNTVGGNTVYGAAYGGMVVGAQVLLALPITRAFIENSRELVIEHLTREFEE